MFQNSMFLKILNKVGNDFVMEKSLLAKKEQKNMCKIIIADGEYLEREVLKRIINKIDNIKTIGECNTATKAIELCLYLKPELIVLNKDLSGQNYVETIKKIKENNSNIAIILTSSFDNFDVLSKVHYLVDDHLFKPFSPETFEKVIIKYSKKNNTHGNLKVPPSIKKEIQYYPRQIMSKEITKTLDYIDKVFNSELFIPNLTLEEVAANVYLSTNYFSRLFKKEVGVNFSTYITYRKLEEAKKLLEFTNKSILEISTYLGFKEQPYFCRIFKKNIGITPTQYRSSLITQKKERREIVDKYLVTSKV